MDKIVKGSMKGNIKLASRKIKSSDICKTKELIAAATEPANKIEHDVKVVERQPDKTMKQTLMLKGLG